MNNWPTNEVEVKPELTDEQRVNYRNAAIEHWLDSKKALDEIKAKEMANRKLVTELLFPNPSKGTQRFPLANGFAIKYVHKLNYTLGLDKTDDQGVKVRRDDQVFELQAEIEKLGEIATLLADRLVKWTPALSVSEYEKLDLADPVQRKIRDLIDGILVIKSTAPDLEFEEPKS